MDGNQLMASPRLLSRWKEIATAAAVAVAWLAGHGGWFIGGPGDSLAVVTSTQTMQQTELEKHTTQLARVESRLDFVTELLCDQVFADSARSRGDRILRQRCTVLTRSSTATPRGAGG